MASHQAVQLVRYWDSGLGKDGWRGEKGRKYYWGALRKDLKPKGLVLKSLDFQRNWGSLLGSRVCGQFGSQSSRERQG